MELREKIINATIDVFQKKGLKFTMDDVAKELKISKKTLYQVFSDKEDMLYAVADYSFAHIKKSEQKIVEDDSLDTLEKLKRIMIVLPERYQNIGLNNLYQLKDKYPGVYDRVAVYLETDWDATIILLQQAMKEGLIRNVKIPFVKAVIESTIQHFMSSPILIDNNMTYEEGLKELLDLVFDGLCIEK